jgi:hypothetical protein
MSLLANALITLADLKTHLGITDTANDPTLELLINAMSNRFDVETSRNLKQATYTNLLLDGNGERDLSLPNYPVSAIAALTEDDITLTENTDYFLYSSNFDGYLRKLYDGLWNTGSKNIKITMTAGFSSVPSDIQLVCLKQCGKEWQTWKEKNWGETSRSFPDGSVAFESKDLLDDVKAILNRYARLGA